MSERSGPDDIVVMHLMRTYGAHGGEHQLAQYFTTGIAGGVREHFAFIYKDPECAALFDRAGAAVTRHTLFPLSIAPRQNPWHEVLLLLPLLLLLQLRFLRLLHRTGTRVCVVHGVQAALVARLAGWLFRRRVKFLYVHRTTKSIGRQRFLKWIYSPYHYFGGVSKAVTNSLAALAPEDRRIALENGIDWRSTEKRSRSGEPINPSEDGVIISVGRLLALKRQNLVIDALVNLSDRPNLRLWIIGDGPERASLQAYADRLGVADRVVFWGHRTDVPRLLKGATLFIHTSQGEGMSNSVLEAMALGLPSVVVDAPGVTECHVAGETALIVRPDPQEIATAIASLLDAADRRAAMGEAARIRVREVYSSEANRRRFLDVYRRLVEAA